jgi:hypothetical protein
LPLAPQSLLVVPQILIALGSLAAPPVSFPMLRGRGPGRPELSPAPLWSNRVTRMSIFVAFGPIG